MNHKTMNPLEQEIYNLINLMPVWTFKTKRDIAKKIATVSQIYAEEYHEIMNQNKNQTKI
jgi:hypothetical protein